MNGFREHIYPNNMHESSGHKMHDESPSVFYRGVERTFLELKKNQEERIQTMTAP